MGIICPLFFGQKRQDEDAIAEHYDEELSRRFRLYLWGGAHGFATHNLGAYHLVLERPTNDYAAERFASAWARIPFATSCGQAGR